MTTPRTATLEPNFALQVTQVLGSVRQAQELAAILALVEEF